jgi:hypothetical protein
LPIATEFDQLAAAANSRLPRGKELQLGWNRWRGARSPFGVEVVSYEVHGDNIAPAETAPLPSSADGLCALIGKQLD